MKKLVLTLTVLVLGLATWALQIGERSAKSKSKGKVFQVGIPGQISERLAHTRGEVFLRTLQAPPMMIELPLNANLENLACHSDLIVLGRVDTGTSYATDDDGYIFTEWKFLVEEVLKNDALNPIRTGLTITVSRPGGLLRIKGRQVYAISPDFPQFRREERLLLYLTRLESEGEYAMFHPSGFSLANGYARALGKRSASREELEIDALRLAAREAALQTRANKACRGAK